MDRGCWEKSGSCLTGVGMVCKKLDGLRMRVQNKSL